MNEQMGMYGYRAVLMAVVTMVAALLIAGAFVPADAQARPYHLIKPGGAMDGATHSITNGKYTINIENHTSGVSVIKKWKNNGGASAFRNIGYVSDKLVYEASGAFSAVCGRYAYMDYSCWRGVQRTYVLDLKTNKVRRVLKNRGVVGRSGKYLLTYKGAVSDYHNLAVTLYKVVSKGKLKKVKTLTKQGQPLGFGGKKVFFVKQSKNYRTASIYMADRNGKHAKKLRTFKSSDYLTIIDQNRKMCEISTGYTFTYKTQKFQRAS